MTNAPSPRRWLQFRLRTLLLLFLLLALPLAWLTHEQKKIRERTKWLASIQNSGGIVSHNHGSFTRPRWLRFLLRDDSPGDVGFIAPIYAKDAELSHLSECNQLVRLYLSDPSITDAGISHVEGLAKLEVLDLNNTQMTDAGLAHLANLTNLKVLVIADTQVTDSGLAHLTGLTNLVNLDVRRTRTTEAGRQKLRQALPKIRIDPEP